MAEKKKPARPKNVASKKEPDGRDLAAHPFESDSQIENRYESGREKNGSDGAHQDGSGTIH